MKRFLILSFTIRNAETIFEMVDWLFNIYTDLVSIPPFLWAAFYTWIGTKVLFRIDVDHSPAGWRCTWIVAMTYASLWLVGRIVLPIHFRAYEFHGGKFASQMRLASFPFHRKWWIVRTAGNAVFIYSIVSSFYGELCLQGDKSLLKSNFFKEGLVDFNGIKGGISKKGLRFNKRMFPEKVN